MKSVCDAASWANSYLLGLWDCLRERVSQAGHACETWDSFFDFALFRLKVDGLKAEGSRLRACFFSDSRCRLVFNQMLGSETWDSFFHFALCRLKAEGSRPSAQGSVHVFFSVTDVALWRSLREHALLVIRTDL